MNVPELSRIDVRLILENGREYGSIGHLNFADQTVDPSTGSQIIRAEFANPDRQLLPGQFVRGRIVAGTMRNGISVPERAIQISSEEAAVMIVARDSSVVRRTVELGGQMGGQWVIRSGLKPGDMVIVDGWMKVQPGQKVTPRVKNAAARGAAR